MAQANKYQVVVFAAAVALAAGSASAQQKDDHGHAHGKKTETKAQEKAKPAAEKKGDDHGHAHAHDHAHDEECAGHEAPHGGLLVGLGAHAAHLEFVLDSENGKLTAYVLDGEAEKSLRVTQPEIELQFAPIAEGADAAGTSSTLRLMGVASPLTGETVGNTSEFSLKSDKLKGVKRFSGHVSGVTIRGSEFKNIAFQYPEESE